MSPFYTEKSGNILKDNVHSDYLKKILCHEACPIYQICDTIIMFMWYLYRCRQNGIFLISAVSDTGH